jgi:hypothetical protein
VRASDSRSVVACQNPGGSDDGIRPLSHRMRDRFAVRSSLGYDEATEAKLVPNSRVRQVFAELRTSPKIHTPASTRLLLQYRDSFAGFGSRLALRFLLSAFEDDERAGAERILRPLGGTPTPASR